MPKQKSMFRPVSQEAEEILDALEIDPIILGLLQRLPAPGEDWSKAARAQWLNILSSTLDMIYLEPSQEPAIG